MIQELATETGADRAAAEKLALLPFANLKGEMTDFGNYLSETLVTGLQRSGKFEVIERARLDTILEEHKLAQSGVVDPRTAQEIGKVAGAQWVGTGTFANLGRVVDVNSRIINVETGKIQTVSRVRIKMDERVAKLLGEPWEETVAPPPLQLPAPASTRARAPYAEGNLWVFEYESPEVGTVYLSGDFNQWADPYNPENTQTPLALQREADGIWRTRAPIEGGQYSYMFIADGVWVLDAANPQTQSDGSGGWVSILTVH